MTTNLASGRRAATATMALAMILVAVAGCEPDAPAPASPSGGSATPSVSPSPTVPIPRRSPPASPSVAPGGSAFLACATGAYGGLDDRHANADAYRGLSRLVGRRGIRVQFLESADDVDYAERFEALLARDCDIVVAVGLPLRDELRRAALREPRLRFALVDGTVTPALENVLGLTFRAEEPAALAGYLAAGMSRTGTVGTFVGPDDAVVNPAVEGLAIGIAHYNERHGTRVRLLGWDARRGPTLALTDPLDRQRGRALAERLVEDGADVLVPIAGLAGLGAAAAAQDARAERILYVGADSDQYLAAPEYGDVTLTSIVRRIDRAVEAAVEAAVDGSFAGGTYVGTLANGGVALAPYHEFDERVPSRLAAEVEEFADVIVRDGLPDGPPVLPPGGAESATPGP